MPPVENNQGLRISCCGIRCTETALSEIDSGRLMVDVKKPDVQRITLRRGIQAPHPMLQIIFGLALAAVGYFPIHHFIYWMLHGGTMFSEEYLLVVVAVFGAWNVFEATKTGYFFEVELTSGPKRLAFARKPSPAALDELISFIETHFQIPVLREDGAHRQQ